MCPGTTSSTATAASHFSLQPTSIAAHGCSVGNNVTKPNRPTTTLTPNGSATAHIPNRPAPSWGSTYPPKLNPTDSRQLDNGRNGPKLGTLASARRGKLEV